MNEGQSNGNPTINPAVNPLHFALRFSVPLIDALKSFKSMNLS